jgi:hypothetical protein
MSGLLPFEVALVCQCGCGKPFVWTRRHPQGPTPKWLPNHRPGRRRVREKAKQTERVCLRCGVTFKTTANQVSRGWGTFCSQACHYAWQREQPRQRLQVRVEALPVGVAPPLSKPRRYKNAAGYARFRWRLAPDLYVETYEHRIVAERALGRSLSADEVVHHVNGIRDDNRSGNLEVLSNSEHTRRHVLKVDVARVAALYRDGWSTPRIARELRTYAGNIYKHLMRAGVPIRSQKPIRVVGEAAATVRFERVRI